MKEEIRKIIATLFQIKDDILDGRYEEKYECEDLIDEMDAVQTRIEALWENQNEDYMDCLDNFEMVHTFDEVDQYFANAVLELYKLQDVYEDYIDLKYLCAFIDRCIAHLSSI